MPKVSISEAARLTGKSRVTIHRHIDKGKISKEEDGAGNPVIDLAELERVYGALKQVNMLQDVAEQQDGTANDNSLLHVEIENLRERLSTSEAERAREREQLEDSVRDLRAERDRLLRLVEEQTSTVRLLTDQRRQAEEQAQEPPGRPVGGFLRWLGFSRTR